VLDELELLDVVPAALLHDGPTQSTSL